jgi:hypothetical protein
MMDVFFTGNPPREESRGEDYKDFDEKVNYFIKRLM